MSTLEIHLFGPPSVRIDGEPMPRLKTRKGLWLLSLLALRCGRDVDRNWLAGTLWPDADEETSLTYLRQSLSDLRKALGPASHCIKSTASRSLCLALDSGDCDVTRFDALFAQGTQEAHEAAIELYRGPLLEGCTEEWVLQERESRAQAWLRALEALAGHEIAMGNPASAIRWLRQIISAEPLRESAYRDLLRALAAVGDIAAVMDTYRELRLLLRRELNVEPNPETRALFESIRAEARTLAAENGQPAAALISRPPESAAPLSAESDSAPEEASTDRRIEVRASQVRLPRFVSEFIGRGREITAVRRSLTASRLVTLTGVGGVGKTRLAVRIAEEEASRFPIAVGFVDFAPLSELSLVASAAAAALGLREHSSRSGAETIASFVDTRPTLLVLDNCEHILAACANLASDLLRRCPNLRILATSRQRFRISGETEWRVPPLEIPPESIPGDEFAAETLLRSNEALALFMDRAQKVRPGLAADIGTLRMAADICRRLDGIPLALELAAARLHAMTVAQLAERLEERFKILVTGDVTAPGRQKTLRAMLDWSHDLLSDDERTLFRRLSVFAGGWTLEAVEGACPGYPSPEFSLLDSLASLVDKSLVLFSESDGNGRYGMLETVRQYALQKLARSGEEAEIRRVHRDYFASFAKEAAPYLTGPEQTKWLDRLEREHDNLRSALDWCIEGPDGIDIGLGLAGALHRFWFHRSHFAEGRRRYAELLRLDVQALPTPNRALTLQGAGNMAYRQGDYAAAHKMFEKALAIWQQSGVPAKEAELLANLGSVAYFQLDYERARLLFRQALNLHRTASSPTAGLVALHGLGNIAFRTGDLSAARELFEQCADESRECGSLAMEATARVSLGLLEDEEGAGAAAHEHLKQALRIFREIGDVSQEMVCLTNLGMVNWRLGNYPLSAQHYREGLLLAEEQPGNRDERVVTYLLEGVARLAAASGKPRPAAWLLSAGNALRESIGVPRPFQDKQEFDHAVVNVRAELEAPAFETAWLEGQSAGVEVAISTALEYVTEGE